MENRTLYMATFGVGTTLALLLLLRIVQRVITPGHTVARDLRSANGAYRLLQVGDVFAVFLVSAAVVKNNVTGEALGTDLLWTSIFGACALVLLQVVGRLGARTLLRGQLFSELDRGNVAAGVAAGAHMIATGILASRAMTGSDVRGLGLAFAFFALALVTHLAFVTLFRALTTYDDAEQIQGGNLAAALSYAGISVAVAVLVARAVEGDFAGWLVSLRGYLGVVLCALALYPVRQIVVQSLLLGGAPSFRGGALDDEIAERNEGMGALEAVTYLAAALAIAALA